MPSAAAWTKVLWQTQRFPDNYIPPDSFLSSLRRNPNFTPYTYWSLVRSCCPITQHLSAVFIFLAVFVRLQEGSLDARVLLWVSVACFALGYALWELLAIAQPTTPGLVNRSKAFKSALLVFLALMGLTPVLRTLTAATSSDSIWALSASLFLLNTLLADYTCIPPGSHSQDRLTSVLSMNAAISSSVVLASRLPGDLPVFALVLFAVQLFALFPILRRRFWALPAVFQTLATLATCTLSLVLLVLTAPLSRSVTALVVALYVTVNLVAPAILVWAQSHKNQIRGPWDVAVPRVNCN